MGVHETPTAFTQADLQAKLPEGKLCATQAVWAGAVRRSEEFVNSSWMSNNIHDDVEPVIVNIWSDDEDRDDNLYLETDSEWVTVCFIYFFVFEHL